MRNSKFPRLLIAVLLGAYLVPGILNSRALFGPALFFKLSSSLSVQNDRSIDLDERPYWISHKHLTSSEQFSSDHILTAGEPWVSGIIPELFIEIAAAYPPAHAYFFPQIAFRAPPLS